MQNKKWKTFDKLTTKCYENMIGAELDKSCWKQAFELLMEIIHEERQKDPYFAPEIEMVDDVTGYEYGIQGWLEDCLDEIDMIGEYDTLLKMCENLLTTFIWPDYTGSDLKFRKSSALESLGRKDEAVQYCKEWIRKEPENIVAATAGVYAYIKIKEFDEAETLVDKFIIDKTKCTDENDIMFTAASKLYDAEGKRKEKKQIDKAIKEYEDYLEKSFEFPDFGFDDDDDFDFLDDDLPFM